MNNSLNFQFGMYEPATDSIIVNTGENSVLIIRCKECNLMLFIFTRWQKKHLCCMSNLH